MVPSEPNPGTYASARVWVWLRSLGCLGDPGCAVNRAQNFRYGLWADFHTS